MCNDTVQKHEQDGLDEEEEVFFERDEVDSAPDGAGGVTPAAVVQYPLGISLHISREGQGMDVDVGMAAGRQH